jgi:ABC-type multidrug transport system ATPase subunit
MSDKIKLVFHTLERNIYLPEKGRLEVFLKKDNWNDYHYKTLYQIILFDENGNKHDLGYVKIANFGQTEVERIELPSVFEILDERFFSLGQGVEYYEIVQKLHSKLKKLFLTALHDIVYDEVLQRKVLDEDVTKISLLRDTSWASIKGQYKRILSGDITLSEYHFKYETLQTDSEAGYSLTFDIFPKSNPPTNIHVLIGRNGVGKTHLLNNMVTSLIKPTESKGTFLSTEDEFGEQISEFFAGIVSVSYSAFDPFVPYSREDTANSKYKYEYIGLKKKSKNISLKTYPELIAEFTKSLEHIFAIGRYEKWSLSVKDLYSDPVFSRLKILEKSDDIGTLSKIFSKLSSGHAIVLLTITKLVETIEEKTLVIIDEPESHLHPPLLSAFIRSLSKLLTQRNAVAIIATHSPIVAQEVPKSCIWNLSRIEMEAKAERFDIETFGENVGILTHEIFGLEVTSTGFYKMLKDDVDEGISKEDILEKYNNELGSEAKFLLQTLILNKE